MKGIIVGLLILATMAALWAATPPGLVNYQGVLRTSAGAPITDTVPMVFTFCSASTGGEQILIDSHAGVAVTGGLFTVQLGGGTLSDGSGAGTYEDLASVFRDYGTVHVEITVGGEVLDQRIRVISSAYALNADNLDGLNSTAFSPLTHAHSGGDVTSGMVNQSYIDGAVARDAEILPAVLASDGAGSTLDADLLDGLHASDLMGSGVDNWVNVTGDTMTGTLSLANTAGPGLNAVVNSDHSVINIQNSGYGEPLNVENICTISMPGWYHYGIWASSSGTKAGGKNLGLYSHAMAAGEENYGGYFEAVGDSGKKYGIYSTVSGAGETYAGYFNGNVTVANGKTVTAASTVSSAGFNLPHGTSPSSPDNGDLWTTTGGLYARINGATVGPFIGAGTDHGTLSGLGDDDHAQYFNLFQSETVSAIPAFNGGTSNATPPFNVDSTYAVPNLNADLLDGQHASAFSTTSHNHDAAYVNVTGDTMTGTLELNGTVGNTLDASVNSANTVVNISNSGTGYPLYVETTFADTTGTLNPAVVAFSTGNSTTGTNVGVFGSAQNSASENYGGRFSATGSAGKRFGVYGVANGIGENTAGRFEATAPGATVNRALYALASGATTENSAGYFDGNVTVINGKATTAATTTARAGLNLPHGTAPSTPANGDLWSTTGGLYAQINGATVGPFTSASGHTHATLTAGTGLSGGPYDGSAPAAFTVAYGTAAGTAVQGNQTATITAGNGLAGGVSANALGDGFSASLALGPLTNHWNQTGAYDIQLNNASSDLVMLESLGGVWYGTLDMGDLNANTTYTFSGASGTVWTTGNDGAGSTLNADLLDGQHGSYYLDTSATTQTKNGKLIFNGTTSDFGVQANGSTAGAYIYEFDSDASTYIAYSNYGIDAYGGAAGGFFSTSAGSGYASVGNQYSGIEGHGTTGGYFSEDDAGGRGDAWIGRLLSGEYWGIRAFGDTGGGYFIDSLTSVVGRVGYGTYSFNGTGAKSFIQNHPYDAGRVIVYAAPEGDEVATYTRGSAKLVNGEARVKLGPTFAWVTNPDIGLTAHLTPRGQWADLYVESLSTMDLVVRSNDPDITDIAFDYLVYGLRVGFEEVSVVQNKQQEAFIPAMTTHRNLYAAQPDLRAYNALERFKGMSADMGVTGPPDLSRAAALKDAIHEFDPAVDTIPSEYDQESGIAAVGSNRIARASAGGPLNAFAADSSASPMPGRQPAAAPGEPHVAESPVQVDRELVPSFTVKDAVERGDVLVLNPANGDELYKCFLPADPMVVGIAAESVAQALAPAKMEVHVIQYGTTWVKADATTAPIARGDLLVASPTLGHAMKATKPIEPGTVIGKALEPLQVGTGLIKVLVMLR